MPQDTVPSAVVPGHEDLASGRCGDDQHCTVLRVGGAVPLMSRHDHQYAQFVPWPEELEDLVTKTKYRDGWSVKLYDYLVRERVDPADDSSEPLSAGTTLVIQTNTVNSYQQDQRLRVNHLFPVPAATYNRESWQDWLFSCVQLVEAHEAAEFFEVDGVKVYAPIHAPGWNPYMRVIYAEDEQRRTSFRGKVKPSADA